MARAERQRFPVRLCLLSALIAVLFSSPSGAKAQVTGGPVRQDSGPLRERSTNVRTGSGSVRESGGSVHEGGSAPLSGSSVRGSATGEVLSGPVSEVSAGPVTSGEPVSGGGTTTDASAGAVTKDIESPIREGIAEPVHGLGRLERQLRAIEPLPREEIPGEQPAEIPPPSEQGAVEGETPEPPEPQPEAGREAPTEVTPEVVPPELPEAQPAPEETTEAEAGAPDLGDQPTPAAAPVP